MASGVAASSEASMCTCKTFMERMCVRKGGVAGWWRGLRAENARLVAQLRGLGLAGVLSYGLLNTLYYTVAFLVVWTTVVKVPRSLGLAGAAQRFVQVMAMVWAGSQITKLPRAAGAVVLAPFVDGALTVFMERCVWSNSCRVFWAGCDLVLCHCGIVGLTIVCEYPVAAVEMLVDIEDVVGIEYVQIREMVHIADV
eukprot:jgi/Chlat1/5832/Chrsp4S00493